MINPHKELREYLRKLIYWFVFITQIKDNLEKIHEWRQKPKGYDALEEGASFFNLVQKAFNQTLLIEVCKFIVDDEEKSLIDFLTKCKENAKPLEPTSLLVDGFPRNIISPKKYVLIINEMMDDINKYESVIQELKILRDKSLAHSDTSFFNISKNHFTIYPSLVADINQLIPVINAILKKQALYLLQADYDFELHTARGLDRVLEFMRAYNTLINEDSNNLKYRWDKYYKT